MDCFERRQIKTSDLPACELHLETGMGKFVLPGKDCPSLIELVTNPNSDAARRLIEEALSPCPSTVTDWTFQVDTEAKAPAEVANPLVRLILVSRKSRWLLLVESLASYAHEAAA